MAAAISSDLGSFSLEQIMAELRRRNALELAAVPPQSSDSASDSASGSAAPVGAAPPSGCSTTTAELSGAAALGATAATPSMTDLADDVALIIHDDMHKFCTLEYQRADLHLGELLLSPLPVSTLDAPRGGGAVFACELLPFEGDMERFTTAVGTAASGREQQRKVIAVTQGSGSGKTKLAYAEGMHQSLVILVRVIKHLQEDDKPPAWETFLEMVAEWTRQRPSLVPEQAREVSRAALAALRVLVTCHVEWVSLVLQAYATRRGFTERPRAWHSASAREYREVALRCLRNGRGEHAVAALFNARMREYRRDQAAVHVDGATPFTVAMLDIKAVDDYVFKIDEILRQRVLWHDARILLWYDEAQALMDKGMVFMRKQDFLALKHDGPLRDVLYGLTALMAWMTDKVQWVQALCGAWKDVSDRAELPEFSCVHARIEVLHHASYIDVDTMRTSISRFFNLEPLPEATLNKLQRLRGRPRWFFDEFWLCFWNLLDKGTPPAATPGALHTRESLLSLVDKAATAAEKPCVALAASMVATSWDCRVEMQSGKSTHSLTKELYAALKLNDGDVALKRDGLGDAVRYAMLACPPPGETPEVNLHDEPLLADAIEARGDAEVLADLSRKPAAAGRDGAPPNSRDPVLSLLSNCLSMGSVAGFELTTSVKGDVFELAFAWAIVRQCIANGGAPTPLGKVLRPLMAPHLAADENLAGRIVHVRRARNAGRLRSATRTEFHAFAPPSSVRDAVLFNVDASAGADIVFCTTNSAGACSLVLVQAKAEKTASMAECLRAASPAWQYTTTPQRRAMKSGLWEGVPVDAVPARSLFETLAGEHPAMFDSAVRVAFSVTPFRANTVAMCNALNGRTECYSSPVVLCTSTPAVFGDALHNALVEDCKQRAAIKEVQHTADGLVWLPHSVSTVMEARRARGTVKGFLDKLAEEMVQFDSAKHKHTKHHDVSHADHDDVDAELAAGMARVMVDSNDLRAGKHATAAMAPRGRGVAASAAAARPTSAAGRDQLTGAAAGLERSGTSRVRAHSSTSGRAH